MKRLETIAAYLAVILLVGVSSLKSAEPGTMHGQARVRSVHGPASYTTPDGATHNLTANVVLQPGSVITTGPDAFAYIQVNGITSAIRVSENTTLAVDRMDVVGSSREGTHDTGLNLKVGSIVGQVKKVSADSRYEISTPHGVAGIRGTDFSVSVTSDGNGQYTVTFTSLTGTVVASAVVDGTIQTHTLSGGESWTVGGDVHPVNIQLSDAQLNLINQMILDISTGEAPPPAPIGPVTTFPQGAPPSGTPSS